MHPTASGDETLVTVSFTVQCASGTGVLLENIDVLASDARILDKVNRAG